MSKENIEKQNFHKSEAFFLYLSKFKNKSLFQDTDTDTEMDLIIALSQKIAQKNQLLQDKIHAA